MRCRSDRGRIKKVTFVHAISDLTTIPVPLPSSMNLTLMVFQVVLSSKRIPSIHSGSGVHYVSAPVCGLMHSVDRVVVPLEFGLTSEGFPGTVWLGAFGLAAEMERADRRIFT
jgi:hypothetical protein